MIILPHFTRALVTRSAATWAFARVVVAAGNAVAAAAVHLPPSPPWRVTPLAAAAIVALVTAAGWIEARRWNEERFFLVLGLGRLRLLATLAFPAIVGEAALALAVAR